MPDNEDSNSQLQKDQISAWRNRVDIGRKRDKSKGPKPTLYELLQLSRDADLVLVRLLTATWLLHIIRKTP